MSEGVARLALLLLLAACAPVRAPAISGAGAQPGRETIAAGVTFARITDAAGPWAIHLLRIDLGRCRPRFRAAKAGPGLTARAATSTLGAEALAAINADFFELPGGRPVGAHVTGGQVLIGPIARPVLAVTASGLEQGPARIEGWVARGTDTVRVHQVNRREDEAPEGAGVSLFTSIADADSAGGLRVKRIEGDASRGRGVVRDPRAVSTGIGPDEVAIEGAPSWLSRTAAGDTVEWEMGLVVAGSPEPVREAVGGFPTLLREGRSVLAAQPGVRPEFGDRRHPRTAIGWNSRSIFMVVVDGRQPPWSDGMSLTELADLLLGLGAQEALNLDGGGSSAMVVRGRVVNRPSDAQGERAVGNALLLEGCG